LVKIIKICEFIGEKQILKKFSYSQDADKSAYTAKNGSTQLKLLSIIDMAQNIWYVSK
jgi:hypothetical protein